MISLIANVGKNLELGKGNDLIFSIPEDMKFFRSTTSGHTIIMGRKTFESLGGVLPKRHHVVLTKSDFKYEGVEVVSSLEEVLKKYKNTDEENFVIGGGEIYKAFLPYADKMYLTEVNAECKDAEVFFPKFNKEEWARTVINSIEHEGLTASIVEYTRK
ncbi:MAG: dihydrofolate reductase [Oscillospiraceae bacterium]|nr:dihydrofolate reductase [Oscillospiraceae bacterium]